METIIFDQVSCIFLFVYSHVLVLPISKTGKYGKYAGHSCGGTCAPHHHFGQSYFNEIPIEEDAQVICHAQLHIAFILFILSVSTWQNRAVQSNSAGCTKLAVRHMSFRKPARAVSRVTGHYLCKSTWLQPELKKSLNETQE